MNICVDREYEGIKCVGRIVKSRLDQEYRCIRHSNFKSYGFCQSPYHDAKIVARSSVGLCSSCLNRTRKNIPLDIKRAPYETGGVTPNGLRILSGPYRAGKRGNATKWGVECPHCNKEFIVNTARIPKVARCYDCRGIDLRLVNEETTYKFFFNYLKSSSYGKDRSDDLTLEDFKKIASMPCHYCGVEPEYRRGKYEWNPMVKIHGLDRVDSSGSYTINNVVACCKWCNVAKLDRSVEDFISWAKRLVEFQNVR